MRSHSHLFFPLSVDAPLVGEDAAVGYCGAAWEQRWQKVMQGSLDPAEAGGHGAPLSIRD